MNNSATSSQASRSNGSSTGSVEPSMRELIGTIVCRGLIPLWLLAGAIFKLAERNPLLLPSPVKSAIFELHAMLEIGTLQEFMNIAMRSIIAMEFVLAAAMIFLPRVSRWLALAILALFIAILGYLIGTGQDQCGCFGKGGPSPRWMLAIDSVLFVLAAIFGPAQIRSSVLGFMVASVLGVALALGMPDKVIAGELKGGEVPAATNGTEVPPIAPSDAGTETGGATRSVEPPPPGEAPPIVEPPAPAVVEWPEVPAKPKGFYLPDFKKWVGQRLSEQPMMTMLRRPLPDGIDSGKWHLVLYAQDCEHCQSLLNKHFVGDLATKTLLVAIPGSSPGTPLPNRVTGAVKTQLLRGENGPDYVLTPPVVVTIVDGVVKAVCDDPAENEAALKQTLDAE